MDICQQPVYMYKNSNGIAIALLHVGVLLTARWLPTFGHWIGVQELKVSEDIIGFREHILWFYGA